MTTTTLDARTALPVIDLQKGIVALPAAHPADEVGRASAMAEASRRHRPPVVLVRVAGTPPGRMEQAGNLGELPVAWTEAARHAHGLGFDVTLAVDAMTDRSPEAHVDSIAWVFPKPGETGTTRENIDRLDGTRA